MSCRGHVLDSLDDSGKEQKVVRQRQAYVQDFYYFVWLYTHLVLAKVNTDGFLEAL